MRAINSGKKPLFVKNLQKWQKNRPYFAFFWDFCQNILEFGKFCGDLRYNSLDVVFWSLLGVSAEFRNCWKFRDFGGIFGRRTQNGVGAVF